MIFEEYFEELENVPYEQALNNMKEHSRNSDYFPTIAVLCKQPEHDAGPYTEHKRLTNAHLLFLEDAKDKAVPMPEDMFKEWLEDE